jgi:hypothetical protein
MEANLAVKYEPGDRVLVTRITGGPLSSPRLCTVIGPSPRSSVYSYLVQGDTTLGHTHVKEDWLAPYETVIQEVPDTPWD